MLSRRNFLAASSLLYLRGQRKTADLFGDAVSYERFMGRWSRLVAPLLVEFTDVPDRGRILDVGSGTGSLAFALAESKARARVSGIDPSKEYVAYSTA